MDSSIKKNTALAKKLKGVGEDSVRGLLEECGKTNQAKVGGWVWWGRVEALRVWGQRGREKRGGEKGGGGEEGGTGSICWPVLACEL